LREQKRKIVKIKKKLNSEEIASGQQNGLDGTGLLAGRKGLSNKGENLSAQEVISTEKKKLADEFGEEQS
jgi:hypothetical protein|tara:strand:- start:475 stop:684 length:210 start_codon:yes stop_codon:yes gene_type:complete